MHFCHIFLTSSLSCDLSAEPKVKHIPPVRQFYDTLNNKERNDLQGREKFRERANMQRPCDGFSRIPCRQSQLKKKSLSGFTLTEMLITLAVILIIALVSIPSITTTIQIHRLEAVAENLYENLQLARIQAIQQNTTMYVTFTTGDSWCYGINSGSSCICSNSSSCSSETVSAQQSGKITLSTTGLTGNTISFENTHGAASSSGSVTLTLYGQSSLIQINISRMGNLQLCSTGISGYTAC